MKNIFTVLMLIAGLNLFAQYDVDIKKEENKHSLREKKQLERETIGNCKFIPFHEYTVGMKFYFPKNESKVEYDKFMLEQYYAITQIKKNKFQQTDIGYKDITGKIFEIIKIEERKHDYYEDTYITLKQIDSAFIIEHRMLIDRKSLKKSWEDEIYRDQDFVLPFAIYTGEIDSFKEKYLNKELYSKFLVNGKKYKKIKIIEVGAGLENLPVRAIVQNENGDKEQIDFCNCGINVKTAFLKSNLFSDYFQLENPKDNFKGSEENWELICQSKIKIGFTENELRLSWGSPERINESIVLGNKSEQYIYSNQYVYLENGIVKSYQSFK